MLCVNNLSRFPQPVELDLRRLEGVAPIELLGGVASPQIGELPYLLTLGGTASTGSGCRPPQPVAAPAEEAPRERRRRRSSLHELPADRPLVRRQGPRPHRSSTYAGPAVLGATPSRARSSASSCSTLEYAGEQHARGRDLPGAARRTTPSRGPARARPRRLRGTTTARRHVHAYDALHDREATALWLQAFAAAATRRSSAALRSSGSPAHDLDLDAHSALFSGEQSNSSMVFGEDALLKVFRKVDPGLNPDIEIHEALAEPGSEHIAALLRLARARRSRRGADEPPCSSRCCRSSCPPPATAGSSPWPASATCSPRPTCTPTRSAATSPARRDRLGAATAQVHAELAERSRPSRADPTTSPRSPPRCRAGSTAALEVVPELEAHAEGLRARLRGVAGLARRRDATAQRVHGDCHLGQMLRTVKGWKIVDFEGEPAKPLAERVLPDLVWRDVAGMLRSLRLRRPTPSRRTSSARRGRQPAARVPRGRVGRPQPGRVLRGYTDNAGWTRARGSPPRRT